MKIFAISGPTNAGKSSVIAELMKESAGQDVAVANYYRTRAQRPGEENIPKEYFLTPEQFAEAIRSGKIAWHGQNADYEVGSSKDEFNKAEIIIVDISPQFVEHLEKIVQERKGQIFKLFLTAPKEQRIERHRLREGLVIYEPSIEKVENDITKENSSEIKNYDIIVENKDGDFEKTVEVIKGKFKEFIKS